MNGNITLTESNDKKSARVQVDFGEFGKPGFRRSGIEGPKVQETGTIFTQEELKGMLDRLTDPSGWKKPLIGNSVAFEETPLAVEAVRHYLGGRPTLTLQDDGKSVKVTGAGYYEWIGA